MRRIKLEDLPAFVRSDVEEFLENNPRCRPFVGPGEEETCSPEDLFDFYLMWNGIQSGTKRIINVVEALGWERPVE